MIELYQTNNEYKYKYKIILDNNKAFAGDELIALVNTILSRVDDPSGGGTCTTFTRDYKLIEEFKTYNDLRDHFIEELI